MTSAQTALEPVAEGHSTTDGSAQQHQASLLSELEHLLRAQDVRTSITHRVGLRLRDDETNLFPRTDQVELAVSSREGWEVATVTVGLRSGCFMVCLPVIGIDCQVISGDRPDAVVNVIVAVLPKET
ncbi:hypothetical protein ABT340_15630 [Streptosporangium sp. NPDC000239]|uniref:hypothetical protein n=1 Tax=Streptosporangium sp. NPDC000239 TaxID=3154248 RepID=UPI003333ACFF